MCLLVGSRNHCNTIQLVHHQLKEQNAHVSQSTEATLFLEGVQMYKHYYYILLDCPVPRALKSLRRQSAENSLSENSNRGYHTPL